MLLLCDVSAPWVPVPWQVWRGDGCRGCQRSASPDHHQHAFRVGAAPIWGCGASTRCLTRVRDLTGLATCSIGRFSHGSDPFLWVQGSFIVDVDVTASSAAWYRRSFVGVVRLLSDLFVLATGFGHVVVAWLAVRRRSALLKQVVCHLTASECKYEYLTVQSAGRCTGWCEHLS